VGGAAHGVGSDPRAVVGRRADRAADNGPRLARRRRFNPPPGDHDPPAARPARGDRQRRSGLRDSSLRADPERLSSDRELRPSACHHCCRWLVPRRMSEVIALVDDDRNILTSVSIALQAEGFVTRVYTDPMVALKAMGENAPDLAVLDIKMPQMDGMELLRRMREGSAVPAIFLTSKDDELDEALGLAMGADDYISKPFSQRLLIARIRAILRRQDLARGEATNPRTDVEQPLLERGRLTMDPARHKVRWDEKDVILTVTEFLILE